MHTVRKTRGGIDYLATVLRNKQSVVSRAVFWRVPHNSGDESLCLKIGRYKREGFNPETLLVTNPKSELTLDDEELRKLLQFISENYEPLRAGASKYIAIDETMARQSGRERRGDQDEKRQPYQIIIAPSPHQRKPLLIVPPCDRRGAAISSRRIGCRRRPSSV